MLTVVALLVLAQPISREVLVGEANLEPSPFAWAPSLISGNTMGLLLWEDARNLGARRVGAARLLADGGVLDRTGLDLAEGVVPRGAFDGQRFLVVSEATVGAEERVQARFVTLDAGVSAPFAVCVAPGNQVAPSVAFDGTTYVVAWVDSRTSPAQAWAARVQPDGTVLEPSGFRVVDSPAEVFGISVAASQGLTVATWGAAQGGISRVSSTLLVNGGRVDGGTQLLSSTTTASGPFGTSTPFGFTLGWTETSAGFQNVFTSTLNPLGSFLAGPTAADATAVSHSNPVGLGAGSNVAVLWEEPNGSGGAMVRLRFISGPGASFAPSGATFSSEEMGGLGLVGTQVFAAVGSSVAPGRSQVRLRAVAPPAQALGPAAALPVESLAYQQEPDVAVGPGQSLVVWTEEKGVQTRIRAARFDAEGLLLDPVPLDVADLSGGSANSPRVATNGTDYFVVWEQGTAGNPDVFGRLVQRTGGMTAPVVLGQLGAFYETAPAIVWDGAAFVVVWSVDTGAVNRVDAARVSAAGAVLGVRQPLLNQTGYALALAAGAGAVLLSRQGDAPDYPVVVNRLDTTATLTALDDAGVTLSTGAVGYSAVGCDGVQFVSGWSTQAGALAVRHVSFGGVPVGAGPRTLRTGVDARTLRFGSAIGGANVTWFEELNGLVRVARVISDGGFSMVDAGFEATPELSLGAAPAVGQRGPSVQWVYPRYDGTPGVRAVRVVSRFVGGLLLGEPCGPGTSCLSGVCQGVCLPGDAGVALVVDAGVDAGAGAGDAGAGDAGSADAGSADAGDPDAGTADAGSPDAGGLDAGLPDGGAIDAGESDGGAPDAGSAEGAADGGSEARTFTVGCGCAAPASSGAAAAWLLVVGLVLRPRRRPSRWERRSPSADAAALAASATTAPSPP